MNQEQEANELEMWPVQLHQALVTYFSLDDLREVCLRLGIDFEELGEGGKSRRVMALLRYVAADGRLEDLLDVAADMRPHVEVWEEVRLAAQEEPDLFSEHFQDEGTRLQKQILIGGGIVALLAVIAAALWFLGVFDAPPDTMGGDFNIAVAEFATISADGALTNDDHDGGLRVAERVGGTLQEEFGEDSLVEVWFDSDELRRDHRVEVGIVGDDLEETPEAAAERLGADMIVYGRSTPGENFDELSVEFYVAPQFGQNISQMVGSHRLAGSIPVFDITQPSEEVWRKLNPQAGAVARLATGIRQEKLGEPATALASFQRAAELLPDSDIVQFFVGQENIFLAQEEGDTAAFEQAAEEAFQKSLALSAGGPNPRSQVGLGGVHFLRAQNLLNETKDPGFGGDLATAYEEVIREAQAALDTFTVVAEGPTPAESFGLPVRSVAQLGQGQALRVLGDATFRTGDVNAAETFIDEGSAILEATTESLETADDFRLLAQLNQTQGTVYEWKSFLRQQAGDEVAANAAHDLALVHYGRCVELGEEFPFDTYMVERIVDELCRPRIDVLQVDGG